MEKPELQLNTLVTVGKGRAIYRVIGFDEDAMGEKYVKLTANNPNCPVRWRYRDIYLNGKLPIKLTK